VNLVSPARDSRIKDRKLTNKRRTSN